MTDTNRGYLSNDVDLDSFRGEFPIFCFFLNFNLLQSTILNLFATVTLVKFVTHNAMINLGRFSKVQNKRVFALKALFSIIKLYQLKFSIDLTNE